MDIIEKVKSYVITQSENYKKTSEDSYDFWNEHIKYVYNESIILANKYNADLEIVSLGALLHDIALINRVGERKDHHINGEIIAKQVLTDLKYDNEKLERVLKCVLHHRSSKNAENIEETCVADADIIAHFDNIPMLFNYAFKNKDISLNDINEWIVEGFEEEYNDLSDKTKVLFKERYNNIKNIIIKK